MKTIIYTLVVVIIIFGFGSYKTEADFATSTDSISCPLITHFLKKDGNNDKNQMIKLQTFLRNTERLNVEVNGVFDQKTEDAVKIFQKRYQESVLGPWDASRATGFIFITTQKKINQIACKQPLTLSGEELQKINNYKNRAVSGQLDNQVSPVYSGTYMATSSDGFDSTDGENNTASVAGTSTAKLFWNFLKGLFR
ncbi:MAG: peptidoglycan-binding domain-containing protein [Patescibacteria group bacterium]